MGRHLTLKAELDHLHDHFQQVFADLPPEEHAPCPQTMRLSEQEISEALAGLPTWKAAPLHCQPNLVWKVFAPAIAPALYQIMQGCIQNQMIPRAWQDSWLILLPKPGKLGMSAKDLRPISLQDPGGKALLKQLTLQARTYCLSYLCALPLYGYLPFRGTADALQRVFSHCFEAESLCKANTYSIHRLRQGHQTTELAGGLQLAIDISAAFDRVERERLWLAMEQSEIPPDLAAIIKQWHLHAHYHIEHAGLHRSFRSTRGVRQGCVCAPLLWVLYTKGWLHKLAAVVGWEWLLKGLTVYADDVHGAWLIHSEKDFLSALVCIRVILQSLADIGLCVNKLKTVLLLRLVGRKAKRLRSKYLCCTKEGLFLKLWLTQEDTIMSQVRVVRSHIYLGAVITYFSPAEQTYRHRQKAAISAFNSLRRWWSKGSLQTPDRIRLWRTCIWPCLTYALSTVGLTDKAQSSLRGLVARQLRRITGDRWMEDGLAPDMLFRKYSIMDPVVEVCQQHLLRWKRRTDTLRWLAEDDILRHPQHAIETCQWYVQWTSTAYLQVSRTGADMGGYRDLPRDVQIALPALPAPSTLECSYCDRTFSTMLALRVHQGRMHKSQTQTRGSFDRALDSCAGMPICRWCGVRFQHWPGLQLHHESNACSGKMRANQGIKPVAQQAEAARFHSLGTKLLSQLSMRDLNLSDEECAVLASHCVICHQWTNRPTSLAKHVNTHLQRIALVNVKKIYLSLVHMIKFTSPCSWCHRSFSSESRHICLIFWQRAILKVWSAVDNPLQATAASSTSPVYNDTSNGGGTHVCAAGDRSNPGASYGQTQSSRTSCSISTKEAEGHRSRRRQRQKGRPTSHDGQVVPPTRGCHQRDPVGYKFRSLRTNSHRQFDAVHCTITTCGGSSMEASKGIKRRHSITEKCPPPDDARDPEKACERGESDEARLGGVQEVGRPEHPGRQRLLPLPDMEQHLREARDRQDTPSTHNGRDLWSGQHHWQGLGGSTHSDEIPQCQTTSRTSQGTGLAILPLRELALRTSSVDSRSILEIERQFCLDVNCSASSDGDLEAQRLGRADFADDPGTHLDATSMPARRDLRDIILEWRVINDGNMCYMDSVWITIVWAIIHLRAGPSGMADILKMLLPEASSGCSILLRPLIQMYHDGWENQLLQHDVAEYLAHVLQLNRVSMGSWEARSQECNFIHQHDNGSLSQPLGLPIPEDCADELSLTECVRIWHQQSHCYALTTAVPWLVLQYPRFREQRGRIIRCPRRLHVPPRVQLPYFLDHTMSVGWAEYTIVGVILHKGLTPYSGHYTCAIRDERTGLWYVKDDLKNDASPMVLESGRLPLCDIYLLALVSLQNDRILAQGGLEELLVNSEVNRETVIIDDLG